MTSTRTRRLILLALVLAAMFVPFLAGCAGNPLESPAGQYVTADKATFNAVAPEYSGYVAADTRLTPEQKARRQNTLGTWRLRIETAQRNATTATPPPVATPAVAPIP